MIMMIVVERHMPDGNFSTYLSPIMVQGVNAH